MPNQILVPSLGESITEATVSKWFKQVGESVDSDEPLVELETDKVNIEVPSPLSGTLTSIKVKEGDVAEVGALLGIVKDEQSSSTVIDKEENRQQEKYVPPITAEKKNINKKSKKTHLEKQKPLKLVDTVEERSEKEEPLILDNLADSEINNKDVIIENEIEKKYVPPKTKKNLSPAVRKIAEENQIDISNLEGSGKDGRISKGDLLNLMGNYPQPSTRRSSYGLEERVKMTRLRVTIAKRLKESQDTAATLSTFNEVNMQSINQMRQDYKEDFQNKYSVKLGFMSFFVKSCVVALKNFPALNAEIEGNEIVYKNYYNIGIAVGTDRGLVVPVLKKADELSFADIEKNIFLLSEKARKGKIIIDDLQGGTFTISNGGIYGSMLSTPILNPPQTGVLGMHNIVERPVAKEGNIVIRPIMYLALSYDHRIVDGKEAVSFLRTVKECLEEPRRLFLDL
ncbi:MAG: 2-oxoglutarate dehydrogenase complex dihydrolipoyllysine-residue succinyltransferase [Pelagibacteraceae bacterium]|nr:2-oxoglutarate dehydrogenase complex dihydrolipoyllysine-residue succinyltransferase [Pelagibacteraceae bacterium]